MTKEMRRPVVGLTLDSEAGGGYSRLPFYALRENYCDAVTKAGGVPLLLPHETGEAEAYLDLLDALIVTGGDFDVDPAVFGAAERHESVTTKGGRTTFELAIAKGAVARDLPILGICGGAQLLNVALGGTLIQHIPDAVEGALAHEQPNPRTEPGHKVRIEKETLLYRIVGTDEIAVNSAHHQAVDRPAPGFLINARAPDGVIEGIESKAARFCLGVQWHPEYAIDAGDPKIFAALIESVKSA